MAVREAPPLPRSYAVRPYRPGDEAGIVALVRSVFPFHRDRDVEYWQWLAFDYPIGRCYVEVAESEGAIIGCEYSPGLDVKLGDGTLAAVYAAMDAVHPDFRGMGVYAGFSELRNVLQEGIQLAFWLTTNPIMVKDSLETNSHYFPHTLLEFTKILDFGRHLKRHRSPKAFLETGGYLARRAGRALENLFTRQPSAPPNLQIREITSFDERADDFWREIRDHYTFAIERSRAYLNWRYCDPRSGHHVVKLAEEGERIVGFCVAELPPDPDEGFKTGRLTDLLTLPDRSDVADALVEEALKDLARRDTHSITCLMVGEHPYAKVLKRRGFVPLRAGPSLFVRQRAPGVEEEFQKLLRSSPDRVHVCHGDFP
jgi:ribosomal protein S18 acetylase RimI-like enzyme